MSIEPDSDLCEGVEQCIQTILECYLENDAFQISGTGGALQISFNDSYSCLGEIYEEFHQRNFSFNVDTAFELPSTVTITDWSGHSGTEPDSPEEIREQLDGVSRVAHTETKYSERLTYRGLELSFDIPENPDRTTKVSVISFHDYLLPEVVQALDDTPFACKAAAAFGETGFVLESDARDIQNRECLKGVIETLTEQAWSDGASWLHAEVTESPSLSHIIFIIDT
jgi:hypothetical protein